MKVILTDILIDGDKAQAFHCYRETHKERFALTFFFADGTSCCIANRHMASASFDIEENITIRFVTAEVKLTGENLQPLLSAISRGGVAQIYECHAALETLPRPYCP